MYWYNYEILKKWLCEKSGLYEPTFMINFASGALSGSVSFLLLLLLLQKLLINIETEQDLI